MKFMLVLFVLYFCTGTIDGPKTKDASILSAYAALRTAVYNNEIYFNISSVGNQVHEIC